MQSPHAAARTNADVSVPAHATATTHPRVVHLVWLLTLTGFGFQGLTSASAQTIEPWEENRWYWAVGGEPVLLLGGSDDDNLFQWPEDQLLPQLERIAAAGGNVIRNTMSDRQDRGFERYPFRKLPDGNYDLREWDEVYWERFERLLTETSKRGIIVQIEVWDRFDYTDQGGSDHWQKHPYRSGNNVNYTAEESGLAARYPDHPGANKQPFFFTTPAQRDNAVVRRFQEAFVHKLLDHSLRHGHVLYCIDNETKAEPAWGEYWARLIKTRAAAEGKKVMVTEMWDAWDLTAAEHRQTFDRPDLYDYVDVSQNNHNRGEKHWENFLFVREKLGGLPRPMNTTKTYGADGNKFGHTDQDAIERFWRHLLGGAASIRFHRPGSGLGIGDKAVRCLKAARLLESKSPLWNLEPGLSLLADREQNEAYLAADPGRAYALYFPASDKPGSVELDLVSAPGTFDLHWIDIDRGAWHSHDSVEGGERRTLTSPLPGNMAAVLIRADS